MSDDGGFWPALRATTIARVGLDRTGDAPRLDDLLRFQLAHARARDAITTALDTEGLAAALAPRATLSVASAARDRGEYLLRPDLGRRLDAASGAALCSGPFDAVFIIADGLSAAAVNGNAARFIAACAAGLPDWRLAPIILARQARVAIGDDIGARLSARLAVVLIGERPGLSVPNSMGVYLTYDPRIGRSDAERNCISNIHANGLSPEQAAAKAAWLMRAALARQLTGVGLKDESGEAPRLPGGGS